MNERRFHYLIDDVRTMFVLVIMIVVGFGALGWVVVVWG